MLVHEFNKTIEEMCAYYRDRGKPMEILSDEIGISKRTLQKWKKATRVPKDGSLDLLCEFLRNNNGGHFLNRILAVPVNEEESAYGVFPKDLSEEDIKTIRDSFPGPEEFALLCEMIIYKNLPDAVSHVCGEDSLIKRAALIARYESDMETAKKVFGLNNLYEWRDRVIKYIKGNIFSVKGEIEVLGQEALDAIVKEYRRRGYQNDMV